MARASIVDVVVDGARGFGHDRRRVCLVLDTGRKLPVLTGAARRQAGALSQLLAAQLGFEDGGGAVVNEENQDDEDGVMHPPEYDPEEEGAEG